MSQLETTDSKGARMGEPTDLRVSEPDKYPPQFDPEIVKAIHWCRSGRVRPDDPSAFERAKQLGLLAQDDTWRATDKGIGVLVALGLLDGVPAPERTLVHTLWAVSDHYPTPQFVAAFSDGMVECWSEMYASRREQAERQFSEFGGERWRFFTTIDYLDRPEVPDVGERDTRTEDHFALYDRIRRQP